MAPVLREAYKPPSPYEIEDIADLELASNCCQRPGTDSVSSSSP